MRVKITCRLTNVMNILLTIQNKNGDIFSKLLFGATKTKIFGKYPKNGSIFQKVGLF